MNKTIGIIPARIGSTRFPGKMLAQLAGMTVLERTYRQAARCGDLDLLLIATDDPTIARHVADFGGEAVMTRVDHPTGSDRLVEVVSTDPRCAHAEIIVNIQGDEPLLDPHCISAVIDRLRADPVAVMATVAHPLRDRERWLNPTVVKCVIDGRGRALYFSRSPIPHSHGEGVPAQALQHVGLYAYRREFLLRYGAMPQSPLQIQESLEQLRVLEQGEVIQVAVLEGASLGVDTPEDLKRAEAVICKQNISL